MKHSGIKASSIVNPYIRAQLTGSIAPAPMREARHVKQASKPMNKTESAFLHWLKMAYPGADVNPQAIGLRIANGSLYHPDFMVRHTDGRIVFFETKGRNMPTGTVKIKVAARIFHYWEFNLVHATDRSLRSWEMQRILP